jgi:hypothetical protein
VVPGPLGAPCPLAAKAAALAAVAEGKASWGLLFWIPLLTGAAQEAIIAL